MGKAGKRKWLLSVCVAVVVAGKLVVRSFSTISIKFGEWENWFLIRALVIGKHPLETHGCAKAFYCF